MTIEAMAIEGAWVITPTQHGDDRGVFMESFRADALAEATGYRLEVQQTNTSVSAAGVVRGIHFAQLPPSQAKYVTCPVGALWDVVVDIRTGSPTYGQWDAVLLDDVDRRAVLITEGLGHGFCSLVDGTVATYLCSTTYAPGREHGLDPFDPALAIAWPTTAPDGSALSHRCSEKDAAAPTLAELETGTLLPTLAEVVAFRGR